MKLLVFLLLLAVMVTPFITVTAQPVQLALDKDPVFQQVLDRWLHYPSSFEYFPIYGRVYAGYRISEKGRIENIVILSPGNTRSGFEYQVREALRHMPSLKPDYAGDYALPVAFCYRDKTVSSEFFNPVNKLDEDRLRNRLLLVERKCRFDWSTRKSYNYPQEVWGYYPPK